MNATLETEVTLSGVFKATSAVAGDGRLPLSQALQLGLQVARMVAQAHDAGRVVGELNASRLRFAANGAVALGAMRGTPLAPELLKGEPPDRLSDVYAVGALVYRLLTGKDVAALRVPEPPSHFNPAVDEELDELLLRSLDEDPSERPISGRELEQGLLRVFAELDVEPSTSELQQVISDAKKHAPAPPVTASRPLAAPAPVSSAKYTPPLARKATVDVAAADEDDDEADEVSDYRAPSFAWAAEGSQRTWLIRGGIALAVVGALLVLWPSSKKASKAPVGPVAKEAQVKSAPAPQAVLVGDSLPGASKLQTKKVIYGKSR